MTEYNDDFHREQDQWLQRILAAPPSRPQRSRCVVDVIPGRWVSAATWRDIPSVAGVYAVCLNGMVIYVGQSRNMRHRVRSYDFRRGGTAPDGLETIITPWGQFKLSRWFEIKFKASVRRGDWAMWEVRLIHRLQPAFNTLLKENAA